MLISLKRSTWEVIIVDDGSNPPVEFNDMYRTYRTNDTRPWTQPAARNLGVKKAIGEYVLCLDIDHIVPKETIDFLLNNKVKIKIYGNSDALIPSPLSSTSKTI